MYWVSMTDKYMSGWGHAKNKINKLVLPCKNFEEAEIVKRNARDRSEMKHINICSKKPYYNKNHYFTSYHNNSDYSTWYQKNRPFNH